MKFVDKYNAVVGTVVTILTALFGIYWYVFAGYLLSNILDWGTGWYKARRLGKESSKAGLKGIFKKLGYWVIILAAFLLPELLINLGEDVLGINFDFMLLLGWFTLACLLVNEICSILENLVECGYNVPSFLIKGLAVTEKLLNAKMDDIK
jgi:toxin secretion/phage lysis holin